MAITTVAKRNAALLDPSGMLLPDGSLVAVADRAAMVGMYSLNSADMVCEVQLANMAGDTTAEVGVSFRLEDTSNFLAAYVDKGDSLAHLSKFVAGTETSLATAAWTPTATAEIRVFAQATRLRFYVDRKLVIDTTDATFQTATNAGLFSRSVHATAGLRTTFANPYAQGL